MPDNRFQLLIDFSKCNLARESALATAVLKELEAGYLIQRSTDFVVDLERQIPGGPALAKSYEAIALMGILATAAAAGPILSDPKTALKLLEPAWTALKAVLPSPTSIEVKIDEGESIKIKTSDPRAAQQLLRISADVATEMATRRALRDRTAIPRITITPLDR